MFGRESDLEEESGLLRNGKRYKRSPRSYILGQNPDYTSLSQEDSESEETPFIGNPLSLCGIHLLTLRNRRSAEVTPARIVLS